jgi:antitoxin (DNA-binding transcriptional repressor) of toxin-antitoxin stability system
MTVTDLEKKLSEVIQNVEKGEVIEITKDGESIAVLSPPGAWNRGVTGFGPVEIKGSLETLADAGTYDLENLRGARTRKL